MINLIVKGMGMHKRMVYISNWIYSDLSWIDGLSFTECKDVYSKSDLEYKLEIKYNTWE